MVIALALALAVQQRPVVLDTAVYRDPARHIALPRPFDDWVFAPAATRAGTTVIFQPASAHLSDQLWGALVLTRWGGPVRLDSVADRRLRVTWRPTLGAGFALLARDSLSLAGWPAVRLRMSGAIAHAVVTIEEYLVARDSDLVALQLRYPRGLPHDSIAAGYQRLVAGLNLGEARPEAAPAAAVLVRLAGGQAEFELPEALRAVAPGQLSADASSGGRRIMRWRPVFGEPDTSLYAVGRYSPDTRRIGRLTLRIWRRAGDDSGLTRVGDSLVSAAARDWSALWHDFGPLPVTELTLVETSWPSTRGSATTVFVGSDVTAAILAREISRAWWGGLVRPDSLTRDLVNAALPLLSAALIAGDSGFAEDPRLVALERARAAAGPARFREAIRTFVAQSRGRLPATRDLLTLLGPEASSELRQLIVEQ